MSKTSSSSSSSSSRTPTKRILTELTAFNATYTATSPHPLISALAPSASNLLHLNCILSGHGLPAPSGYSQGRWLLRVALPASYPNAPPTVTFVTRVCHPNVKWETGEVCLDVLADRWTPVLGVVGALESVGRLLLEPGVDSPLNVDVAALERSGDRVAARALVGFYCEDERWEGGLVEAEAEVEVEAGAGAGAEAAVAVGGGAGVGDKRR